MCEKERPGACLYRRSRYNDDGLFVPAITPIEHPTFFYHSPFLLTILCYPQHRSYYLKKVLIMIFLPL